MIVIEIGQILLEPYAMGHDQDAEINLHKSGPSFKIG
jgi:hypothetical protein